MRPSKGGTLKGRRFALPRLYANAETKTGSGIGGPTGQRIETRASVMDLLQQACDRLQAEGAEVVLTDFPLIENYEGYDGQTIWTRGLLPDGFKEREILDLSVWAWDDFLKANGHPGLAVIDGAQIFPQPEGALPDRYHGFGDALDVYPSHAGAHDDFRTIPLIAEGLKGLEETRRIDLEDWMDRNHFDAVIFPALADVGRADADRNQDSADHAWSNGVWVANGNLAIRHLGIPTVTLPMGIMADTKMPAGLTLAGRAYDDLTLLDLAAAMESASLREPPPRTPPLPPVPYVPATEAPASLTIRTEGNRLHILAPKPLWLCVAGQILPPETSESDLPAKGSLVLALFSNGQGAMVEL